MRLALLTALSLLGGLRAQAQQPALPAAPPAPVALPAPVPPSTAATPPSGPIVGHRYEVKLSSGVAFTGRLVRAESDNLSFETAGLGTLIVAASNIQQLSDLDEADAGTIPRLSRYDIGSGSRYFFGPSARNLRQGEGVVQDVWLFLVGVNYGITNNISLGGYVSLMPGVGLDNQFLMLTPKIGFDVGHNWHLGAGALYLRVPGSGDGYGAGVVYGVGTHGTADNNFSLGVGYGFASNGVGSTPTIYLAGQTRVSRRLSLMTENYFIAASNPLIFGLYGVKINWPRVSLGIASGYAGYIDNSTTSYGSSHGDSFFAFGYVYPIFLDVSYRFGRPHRAAAGQ